MFPAADSDLNGIKGLVMTGGDLEPASILHAYRHGIFPWYSEGEPILWWSPDPRMVVLPDRFQPGRSLTKRIRHSGMQVSFNRCFPEVIDACAMLRQEEGTWITADMREAYCELHRMGWAHSFETWLDDRLVGGFYGLAIGQVFFGESMFHKVSDASKIAFAEGMKRLCAWGYQIVDCQVATRHLASLGGLMISRADFLELLQELIELSPEADAWCADHD
ncbi:MAG: hypothetical protein RIQ52_482 [Pseudomonadota bacterium]|jgi:leucyl/phenylalanyl-tRNA--protein transferase